MEFFAEIKGLDLIIEYLIKSSLVLTFTLLLFFLSRKKSASLKHFMLSFSLISLLLIPIVSSVTTGWETKLLPSWQTKWHSLTLTEGRTNPTDVFIPGNLNNSGFKVNKMHPIAVVKKGSANKRSLGSILADYKNFWGIILVMTWSLGILFLLTRICLGLYGAYRLTRQSEKIYYSSWQQLLQKLLKILPLKRKISLLSHHQIMAPLTWGIRKPVVIFPAESRKWTICQCSSALFHEISHIKRGDFLVKLMARISCALFWFNPLSWLTLKIMKQEQEKACDELVLKAGVKPSTYAANLLSLKKLHQNHWNPPAAVLGAVGKSQLNDRLIAILKKQFKPKEIKMKTKILLSFTVILVILIIGFARPSQTEAYTKKHLTSLSLMPAETSQAFLEQDNQEKQEKKKTTKKETQAIQEKKEFDKLVIKKGEKGSIEIHVIEGDKVKKLGIEGKKITIIGQDGTKKTFVISADKGDLFITDDKEGHWTIKADKLEFIKGDEVKTITLKDGTAIWVQGKDEKDFVKAIKLDSPKYKVITKGDIHKADTFYIHTGKGDKKIMYVTPHAKMYSSVHLETEHEKLKEKIKEIREKLKKIKEEEDPQAQTEMKGKALEELEEMLEELEEGLQAKSNIISYSIHKSSKSKDQQKDYETIESDHAIINLDKEDKIVAYRAKDNGIQVIFRSKSDVDQKARHEELLKKLKEKLPPSYKIESITDEETNTFTIKITTDNEDKGQKKDALKLLKEIIEELKNIKDKGQKTNS